MPHDDLARRILDDTSDASATGVPTRPLGRTGERVSVLGIGGWNIGFIKEEAEAIRVMHAAMDEGVTFFDNAWDYHDGHSEEVMGRALAMDGRRRGVFLMTKVCDRDHAGAKRHLEDSLRRLRTDVIDLWQFHEMVYDNDPDWVFDRGGIRAALEAQREGKIRFIGFTGHKDPLIHRKMLGKPHAWDACQMPNNVCDDQYRSFRHGVMPLCLENGVGIIGMKGLGGHPDGPLMTRAGLTLEECIRYCLSQPVSVQVMGVSSMDELRRDIEVARRFTPLSPDEQASLADRVRDVAGDGRHELFKSSKDFDGPHHRRQHGFAA